MYSLIGNKFKHKTCFGIVTFGSILVGSFDYHTSEDCFGKRQLFDLSIKEEFLDIPNKTSRELTFMFVESGHGPYKIIDGLGVGTVQGSFFLSGINAQFAEATFSKLPSKLN